MPVTPRLTLGALAALALFAAPVAAFGQGTEEQQQACTPDAVKLCYDSIPDIPKTTACMKAHFSQLSPRCQTAFGDATGGAKTKTASRKAEPAARKAETPKARVATRAERRMPERAAPAPRPEREAREPAPREERQAALPPRADTDPTVPPQIPGYPPFPSAEAPVAAAPASGPAVSTPRSQIAQACRAGLIDSFTCRTTVPALLGSSGL